MFYHSLYITLVILLTTGLFGPGVFQEETPEVREIEVTLFTDPAIYVEQGEQLDYTMLVEHTGDEMLKDVRVNFTFNEDQLDVLDVLVDDGNSWVRSFDEDSVSLMFRDIGPGEERAVVISTEVDSTLSDNERIEADALYTWSDRLEGSSAQTSTAVITVDASPPLGRTADEIALDTTPPVSEITDIAAQQRGYRIWWTGVDNLSGIESFDVQVCQLPCDVYGWHDFRMETTDLSEWFGPTSGSEYGFRVRARDFAGNEEPWPVEPDITTLQAAR